MTQRASKQNDDFGFYNVFSELGGYLANYLCIHSGIFLTKIRTNFFPIGSNIETMLQVFYVSISIGLSTSNLKSNQLIIFISEIKYICLAFFNNTI